MEATGVAVKKAVDILQLSAVTVGGESGAPVADARSELLGFRIWHTDPAEANKRLQQEVSKEAGSRSVRSQAASAGRHPGLPAFGADAQCRQARGVGRARSM